MEKKEKMRIGFVTNMDKDPELNFTQNLISWIELHGHEPIITDAMAKAVGYKNSVDNADELYKNSDAVVVLGGDGTILGVARKAALFGTPIMGINIGTLGYLADVEKNAAFVAMDRLIRGEYKIEKRMMLKAYVNRGYACDELNLALNEVCITNSVFSRMIKLGLQVNDDYINTFRADGIIVATPTGSTAYNLSAGGPILKPDTELMAITHICPHALYTRPFVVSGNDVVKINIKSDYNNIQLAFDGQRNIPVRNGDEIIIKKAKYYTHIIKTTNLSFYDILRRKMVEVRF
jgi:NAD+ kinase